MIAPLLVKEESNKQTNARLCHSSSSPYLASQASFSPALVVVLHCGREDMSNGEMFMLSIQYRYDVPVNAAVPAVYKSQSCDSILGVVAENFQGVERGF